MTDRIFRHRSGRVIATGRLVLAAAFLLAILIDPTQPNQRPDVVYALLIGYVVWAAGLIGLTWRNWWLDFRLAAPSHLADVAVFGIVVYFTEGYTSPFFTFFVFLLLSAAIRWGWRETALTAALVLLLYMAAGTAALLVGAGEFELERLLVRSTYLVVLSLVFVWFAFNQRPMLPHATASGFDPRIAEEPSPIRDALVVAADRLNAGRLLFAWSLEEEPWQNFTLLEREGLRSERVGPVEQRPLFTMTAGDQPFLFHGSRGRALCRPAGMRSMRGFRVGIDPGIAKRFGIDEGLMIPIRAREYEGELIAMDIEGMSADDLETASLVGSEVVSMLDRASMFAVSEEAAFTRARLSVARDLHDSVLQALAGASFRLEGLKSLAGAGDGLESEIDAVKADLTIEQRNVRAFIDSLRSGHMSRQPGDFRIGLPALLDQLCRRWNLDCRLSMSDEAIMVPVWMQHELRQIIREAAANAARHGRAKSLHVDVAARDGELSLVISDDGEGFSIEDEEGKTRGTDPWSVSERARGLGGSASLISGPTGCRLDIIVPMGERT